eukprot:s171_g39.t2
MVATKICNYQRGGDSTLQAGDRVSFDIEFDYRKGKNGAKNVQAIGWTCCKFLLECGFWNFCSSYFVATCAMLRCKEVVAEVVEAVDFRKVTKALTSRGSCYGLGQDRQPLDSVLVSLLDVSPLGDADPEVIQVGNDFSVFFCFGGGIIINIHTANGTEFFLPCRNAVARTNLGSAYFERGDEDAALHWFWDAYRLDNRSCRILRGVAVLEQRCRNYTEAPWLLRNYRKPQPPVCERLGPRQM